MRPWIIVLSSTVVALVCAVAVIRPELTLVPRAAILASLLPLLPTLAVTGLAVYALCAILLISGDLIEGALRLRRYFADPLYNQPARPNWTAAFEGSGLRRLVPPPAAVQPSPAPADGTVVLQGRFDPHAARREVARLCYIGAARVHFFSALIVLAAGAVLGAAQSYGPLPFIPGAIPMAAAALAVAGLVLLALLARIAVDVAAEPLIELISRLPAEPAEAGLLRRTADLLATVAACNPPLEAAAPSALQIPDRLGAVLEQGHRALFEAIERLSTTTEGLATTTRSSIEALEAAFRATERREQKLAENSAVDTAAMGDLRDALLGLSAALQRVREAPATDDDIEPGASPRRREPDLALELRKLLQEIETTP